MDTSIRDLKANLSALIRRVEAGESVTVRVHKRPVAQIVPIDAGNSLAELAHLPGIAWSGGKPAGLAHGEAISAKANLSDWVIEDRR